MPQLVTQHSTEDWVVEQAQLFEVFLFGMFGVPEAEFSDKLRGAYSGSWENPFFRLCLHCIYDSQDTKAWSSCYPLSWRGGEEGDMAWAHGCSRQMHLRILYSYSTNYEGRAAFNHLLILVISIVT